MCARVVSLDFIDHVYTGHCLPSTTSTNSLCALHHGRDVRIFPRWTRSNGRLPSFRTMKMFNDGRDFSGIEDSSCMRLQRCRRHKSQRVRHTVTLELLTPKCPLEGMHIFRAR